MNILFVMPHPDDEAFAVSGTIKRLTQSGHRVSLIIVTDGSAGKNNPSGHFDPDPPANGLRERNLKLIDIRKEEVENSAKILGVAKTYFLNYADGTLCNIDIRKRGLVDKIVEIIHELKPEVVITYDHTGVYWHIDHVVTSLATIVAVHNSSDVVDKLLFFIPPTDFENTYAPYSRAYRLTPTHSVDITSVTEFKKQSIEAHVSQLQDKDKFLGGLGDQTFKKEAYYLELDNKKSPSIFDIFTPILSINP